MIWTPFRKPWLTSGEIYRTGRTSTAWLTAKGHTDAIHVGFRPPSASAISP